MEGDNDLAERPVPPTFLFSFRLTSSHLISSPTSSTACTEFTLKGVYPFWWSVE